eukprot:Skav212088  [mRNA]  locus=scaffold4509:32149:34342:+ [translate_table: standard]
MIEVQYWKYPLRWVPTRLEVEFAHPRDRDFIFETVDLPKCFNNVHRVAMQDRESWWRFWQDVQDTVVAVASCCCTSTFKEEEEIHV